MAFIINTALSRLGLSPPVTGGAIRPPPAPPVGIFTYIAHNYPEYQRFIQHLDPALDPDGGGGMPPTLRSYLARDRLGLSRKFERFSPVGWSHYQCIELPLKSAILRGILVYFEFHTTQPKMKLHKIRLLHPDYTTAFDLWLAGFHPL